VGALERGLAEQDAVVGDDADRMAVDAREAGDQGGSVGGLELGEPAAVDHAGDHLAHVVGGAPVGGHHAVELGRVGERFLGLGDVPGARRRGATVATMDRTIRSASASSAARWSTTPEVRACSIAAAELLGGHDLAGGGLHQRRAAEEDRALVPTITVSSLIAGT
jgi:hypothetical protein